MSTCSHRIEYWLMTNGYIPNRTLPLFRAYITFHHRRRELQQMALKQRHFVARMPEFSTASDRCIWILGTYTDHDQIRQPNCSSFIDHSHSLNTSDTLGRDTSTIFFFLATSFAAERTSRLAAVPAVCDCRSQVICHVYTSPGFSCKLCKFPSTSEEPAERSELINGRQGRWSRFGIATDL